MMIRIGTVHTEVDLAHASRISLISSTRVKIGEDNGRPVVVTDDDEETRVIELPKLEDPRFTTPDTPLLYHLATLTRKPYSLEFVGNAKCVDSVVKLRLEVLLPPHQWDGDAFARNPRSHAGQLFLHMIPLREGPDADLGAEADLEPAETRGLSGLHALRVAAGVPAPTEETPLPSGPDVVSLRSCVMSVPPKGTAVELPPISVTEATAAAAVAAAASVGAAYAAKTFADLPSEALVRIMTFLDSGDLQALACVCRHLRELARDVGPGLHLTLFPHQRDAIRWMLQREEHPGRVPHPTLRRFPFTAELDSGSKVALSLWGDTATGTALSEEPDAIKDFRGGLFCDEPGLGKTVTSLALILRTRGAVPSPPEGSMSATWFSVPDAGTPASSARAARLGFYEVRRAEAEGAAAAAEAGRPDVGSRQSGRIRDQLPEMRGLDGGKFFLCDYPVASEQPESQLLLPRPRARAATATAATAPAAAAPAVHVPAPAHAVLAAPAAVPAPVPAAARSAQALARRQQIMRQQVRLLAAGPKKENKEVVAAGPVRMEVENGANGSGAVVSVTPAKKQRLDAAGTSAPSSSGGGSPDLNTPPLPRPQRPSAPGAAASPAPPAAGPRVNRTLVLDSPEASSDEDGGVDSDYAPSDSSSDGEGFFGSSSQRRQGPKKKGKKSGGKRKALDLDAYSFEELYGPTSAADADTGEGDGDWLQCDLCTQWRRIPAEHHPPGDAPWCCYQHPQAGWRSCTIRCDSLGRDEAVVECPGWLSPGEAPGAAKNVQFFRETMTRHVFGRFLLRYTKDGLFHGAAPWVKWMVDDASVEQFSAPEGVAISDRAPEGFGEFLADVGFVPAAAKACRGLGPRGGAGQSKMRPGKKGVEDARQDWRRWRKPPTHWRLSLDQDALWKAMQLGPLQQRRRVYLSPATLVVVPSELVQHWKDQIERHTRPGALRVGIYTPASNELCDFRKAPPPHVLAWEYDILITTFSKMSAEWNSKDPIGCSPLTQVHWLRVILDEGHTLGSMTMTNKLQMAKALRAERRWVMTGTPAPSGRGGEAGGAGAITFKCLLPLLQFLHDPVLGGGKAFGDAVEKQLGAAPLACRWRLQAALRRCMIRASKADLGRMPKLSIAIEPLGFHPSHARSYNEFVDLVRLNLLTSDWFDPDHGESLLAAGNARLAAQYLENLRASCNIAGNIALAVRDDDLRETLELVAAKNGLPPVFHDDPPFCRGDHPLAGVEESLRGGGTCMRCARSVRIMLVTPCAHMLCVHCAAQNKNACAHCRLPYVMQAVNDPGRKRDKQGYVNPNPKWAVPKELIEFQPAFAQAGAQGAAEGYWQGDWEHTDSTKAAYLLEELRRVGALPPAGWNPDAWSEWGDRPLDAPAAQNWPEIGPCGVAPKAIIFSQFKLHHELLYKRLVHAVGHEECVASYQKGMTQEAKAAALRRFCARASRCGVLLMDESGALGLDLSFVQHVYLAEPIPNKSLEQQVISRAHRMGAREDVTVKVLAMRGTLEEAILRRNGDWKMVKGAGDEEVHVYDDTEEVGEGSGSGAGTGAGGAAGGEREQEAARRVDRNAYLKALKPVEVEEEVVNV